MVLLKETETCVSGNEIGRENTDPIPMLILGDVVFDSKESYIASIHIPGNEEG